MTFSAPWALLALVALPVFALWYRDRQRSRARDEAAFVTPALAASVLPARPGWRRHAPMLAFALALGVLIVALADPRASRAVAVQRSSIMLAGDVSGSMAATDVLPTRLLAARRAAARFIAEVPAHVGIGVMTFNQEPQVLQTPTTDRAADRRALTGWRAHGGTAIGTAIVSAIGVLETGRPRTRPPAAIVLVSDGGSASGVSALAAARRARAAHIPLYTVAFGTSSGTIMVKGATQRVPPDPTLLAQIARTSHGRAFTARDPAQLSAVYRTLGAKLGNHRVQRHLAAGFAGAALILLLAGGAMSMLWFGRPL